MDKLFIFAIRNLHINLIYNGISHPCISLDGYIDISFTSTIIPMEEDILYMEYQGHEIMQIALRNLENISNKASIISATTCRGFNENQNGQLYPISSTKVFNKNDKFIVLFLELDNIIFDFPINIQLVYKTEIVYSYFDIIPASLQSNGHRTFIHTISIDKNTLQTNNDTNILEMTISVETITACTLFEQKVVINCIEIKPNQYTNILNNSSGFNFNANL
ncbi:MAG: hypothetical protein A2Y23_11215 [Clostridiales bacterium GWB2_37_7]|nr:MAG: hypothetical protein A2Y23_11215 [Clostridiales bacterium GWB2_37_7]